MDQRKCPFCRRILPSYEGCNCIWNENDDNEESVSEMNNSNKLNQSYQQNDGREPQRCSLKPVEAEFARAKFLGNNADDGLFCNNRKEFEELARTSGGDIQCSSDSRDVSGDQNMGENYVAPSANGTTKPFGDSFQYSRGKKYQCSYCPKTFPTCYKHQRHTLVHTGEVPFECGSCGRRFNQKAHLERHRGLYSDRKTFICDECGIEFPLKCALEAHLRSEMENKHFVCDFCRKKFVSKRQLTDHRRSHTRERPYKCTICGMDYVFRRGLQRHEKQHR